MHNDLPSRFTNSLVYMTFLLLSNFTSTPEKKENKSVQVPMHRLYVYINIDSDPPLFPYTFTLTAEIRGRKKFRKSSISISIVRLISPPSQLPILFSSSNPSRSGQTGREEGREILSAIQCIAAINLNDIQICHASLLDCYYSPYTPILPPGIHHHHVLLTNDNPVGFHPILKPIFT